MYTYPKNFLSVAQLIQKLKDAGMTIDSQDAAEMALTTIGYYRLKGYSFHLIDPATGKYIAGTNFSDVLKLYHFDSELSTINEQISNFAQTYPTNFNASSRDVLLFMRRYMFANCSCFSCCFKNAYPSSNVQ